MKDWLRVTRIPFAPTAVTDSVGCALLALSAAGRGPGSLDLVAWASLAITSVLVYAAGMAGNDLSDRERDRVLAPQRPLPSGRLSPRAVGVLVAVLAAGAVALGGGPAGSRWAVASAIALAMAYDFVRPLGLVLEASLMAGVRFANASLGVLPLVLEGGAPPLTLLAPAAVGCYSAGITVLSTTEEAPRPGRARAARILAAAAFLLMGTAAALATGGTPHGVLLGFLFAGTVAVSALAGRTPRKGPVKVQVREMLLGIYYLGFVAASAADGGSLAFALVALAVAFALIFLSQIGMRWLAR